MYYYVIVFEDNIWQKFYEIPSLLYVTKKEIERWKIQNNSYFLWVKSCLIKAWHNLNLLIIAVGNMEKSWDVAPKQEKKKSLALSPKK